MRPFDKPPFDLFHGHSRLLQYGCAILSVVLATWVRLSLDPMLGLQYPYATIFFAVLLAAAYGGFHPGLAALILGALSSDYFLIPPRGSFRLQGWQQCFGMGLYLVTGFGIVVLGGAMREAKRKLEKRVQERTATLALALESLRESQAQVKAIFSSAMDAIISVNEQQRIIMFNASAAKVFGCSEAEALGQPIENFIPQLFRAAHSGHLRKFGLSGTTNRAMGEPGALSALRADGTEFPIDASISHTETDGKRLFTVILRDVTERNRAEDKLRESEERIRLFIEYAPVELAMFDRDMRYVHVSRRWRAAYGLGDRDVQGLSHYDVFPDVPAQWKESHRRGLAGEVLRHEDDSFIRADGSVQRLRWEIRPWRDRTESVGGIVLFTEDITERKQAEEALQEKEFLLSESQRIAHVGTWIYELSGSLTWSEETYRIYGVSSETFTPNVESLLNLMLPEDRAAMQEWIAECAAGKAPADLEFRIVLADGAIRFLNGRGELQHDSEGRPIRLAGTIQDVTQRKRAEELLRQSERHYRTLFDSMEEGFCTVEVLFDDNNNAVDYRFLEVNPAFEKQTGMHNARGRRMREFPMPHEEHWFEIYGKIALTGEPARFESVAAHLHRCYDVHAFRVGEPRERKVAVLFNDITERKRALAELAQQSEQLTRSRQEILNFNDELEQRVLRRTAELQASNKELETFTYSVAHDMRAPLRHINGFSRILMEDEAPNLTSSGQNLLQRINAGANRMGLLVDDLLKLAGLSRSGLNLQVSELKSMAEEVVADLALDYSGRKIEWKINDLPSVQCDRGLMKQVLHNLLSNAVKYTGTRPQAMIEVGHTKESGSSVFFVRDNGVGFDMKHADKLFGVFQRLHPNDHFEGTGVGLAIVERIVQKHGGRVWAEAEPDRGATFYFTLEGSKHQPNVRRMAQTG